MILLITEEADYSSNLVIDWLLFYNINYIRVNESDCLKVEFLGNEIQILSINHTFLLSDIKGMWYRRGFLNLNFSLTKQTDLDSFRKREFRKIKEFIYFKLSILPNINQYSNSDVNKLIVNNFAKDVGLSVPEEYLINNTEVLFKVDNLQDYATKSITGSTVFDFNNYYIVGYTTLLKKPLLPKKNFFPSLIQKYIPKKYELRIFYLHKVFYSMAIFSQSDETTKVDFRNYNRKNPNRNIPFELPNSIKQKLTNLMEKLKLNSGSIDMIVSQNNDFFFLEVNPIGQYGMVSNPCNYNLNKVIALFFKDL